jgi:Icc-related predicted phosphoesterase
MGIRDFEPKDAIEEYRKSLTFLKNAVHDYANQNLIVVTHHVPSKLSTHPKMDFSDLLNGAYSSDLDSFIEAHPQIKFWIHGHTHKSHNYMISNTNIICNPRGYLGAEPMAIQFEWLVIEV